MFDACVRLKCGQVGVRIGDSTIAIGVHPHLAEFSAELHVVLSHGSRKGCRYKKGSRAYRARRGRLA